MVDQTNSDREASRVKGVRLARGIVARLFDITLVLGGLIVLSPVLVVAAMVIRLADGGPILFRHKRIGRNGGVFQILKFRTMRAGTYGLAITASGDPRITRTGAWMRHFKIDELPQLFNVLRGDMSLIGPRPEAPEYVELDDPLWQQVLELRPGITDLASLASRNEEAILGAVTDPDAHYRKVILPEKLRLNLQYQRSRSLFRDLRLLWMTGRYSFLPLGFNRDRILKSLGA